MALQKKDYPNAITSLKAATDDNPSDWYAVYWMGLSYLYSTPRDYDHAIWYDARAVDLAKAGKDPNADAWEKYLKTDLRGVSRYRYGIHRHQDPSGHLRQSTRWI